jgi:hypothetical protein
VVTERAARYWSRRLPAGAVLLSAALSCSGAAFTSDVCDDGCGGAAGSFAGAAGRGDGGEAVGGNPGAGSAAGDAAEAGETGAPRGGGSSGGGVLNLGGGGALGVAGGGLPIGGGPSKPFPATKLLDDFNREGAALGTGWIGGADNYALKDQRLWCEVCNQSALWAGPFAGDQEVFATFAGFDADAREMNLVLRAQESSTCEQIEVLYSPEALDLRVAYCVDDTWTDLESVELLLEAGQQVGGRIHADGKLELFVDGELLATVDASGYPHKIGRVGVSGLPGDSGLFWDDFGGGKWR